MAFQMARASFWASEICFAERWSCICLSCAFLGEGLVLDLSRGVDGFAGQIFAAGVDNPRDVVLEGPTSQFAEGHEKRRINAVLLISQLAIQQVMELVH